MVPGTLTSMKQVHPTLSTSVHSHKASSAGLLALNQIKVNWNLYYEDSHIGGSDRVGTGVQTALLEAASCTMEEHVTKTGQKPFKDMKGKKGTEREKVNKIQQQPTVDQIT